ncbi:MAG: hypothetical protein JKY56_08575 [Kofleriaceae bacterium]|nr:hypothetical protein [Kofleriaceae bacterium]
MPGMPRPLLVEDYTMALPAALIAVEDIDSDVDSFTNIQEIIAGSFPGDPFSNPEALECPEVGANEFYQVCQYDPEYTYRKVMLDFCGQSPSYDDLLSFRDLDTAEQLDALDQVLDACLDSEFWLGKNGELWQLAHRKIRPVGSLKSGEDSGSFPASDYYDDYNLFVWSQTDNRDSRELLLADYFVSRTTSPTEYVMVDNLPGSQKMQVERRAGLLTTDWVSLYNIMFTAVPRTAAAQAYRAFLGYDIAKLEGLFPVSGEPKDYDDKGVASPACAVCHSTLDPMTYPWTRFNGIQAPRGQYDPNRIIDDFLDEGVNIADMPESGMLLGQPVVDLLDWAQVAANSSQYASATTEDYWRFLMGSGPSATEMTEFNGLWQGLMGLYEYSVERMLHDLIKTEAYGAP